MLLRIKSVFFSNTKVYEWAKIVSKISDPIAATIRYAQRATDRPTTEKPFILHYDAPLGIPQNSFTISPFPSIRIHNLRNAGINYQDHGMTIASLDSSRMQPEDFDDDEWIEQFYLPELHSCTCQALGAEDVTIFDWMLRKRARSFPKRNAGRKMRRQRSPPYLRTLVS